MQFLSLDFMSIGNREDEKLDITAKMYYQN